ncbi:MAG: transglutaminase-like domain-containing protein [Bdellovibrionota bacterium]
MKQILLSIIFQFLFIHTVLAQFTAGDAKKASGFELSLQVTKAISSLASACGSKVSNYLVKSIQEGTPFSEIQIELNKLTQSADCLKAFRKFQIIQNELYYRGNKNLIATQQKSLRLSNQSGVRVSTASTNAQNLDKYSIQVLGKELNSLALTGVIPPNAKKAYLKISHENSKEGIFQIVKLDLTGRWTERVFFREGPGDYKISFLAKTSSGSEKSDNYIVYDDLEVQSELTLNPDLMPSHHVESDSQIIINLAAEITKNKTSTLDKAKALYDWIKDNISYDYSSLEKASTGLSYEDIHSRDFSAIYTLQRKTDLCVGYAALYAALLRASNIPTRIIVGQATVGFHAWNEVLIDEKWILTDVTLEHTTGKDYFNAEPEFFRQEHLSSESTLY